MARGGHNRTTPERFWSHVAKSDTTSCWNWTGYISRDGYGKIGWNAAYAKAHEIAFQLVRKIKPGKDKYVLQKCANRLCCNPTHLWIGNQADRNKTHGNRGRSTYNRNTPEHFWSNVIIGAPNE